MQKMTDVYKISIKDHRRLAKKRLTENEKAYASLKNKESLYAKAIKGLQDLHRQVYEIYRDAPDEIQQTNTADQKGAQPRDDDGLRWVSE